MFNKETMKKWAPTLLVAFFGGIVAIGAYKIFEPSIHDRSYYDSFEDQQKAYFARNGEINLDNPTGLPDLTIAASMVTPAVVHITTTFSVSQGQDFDPFFDDDFFNDFFGRKMPKRERPKQQAKATGSGVIISEDGYIITNNHVVENADKIEVSLPDKRSFSAKVIGTDPNTDLALLKINAKDLPIVKIGNSDEVRVGEWVLAVGNPFNLHSTVTAGIVSAKARNIGIIGGNDEKSHPIESFIQTDAAINKGNSGGALVNTRGELIGINAAIASNSGYYEGYGFAIPINLVKKVMDDFIKFGSVRRGFLGVQVQEITPELAKDKKLSSNKGVYVSNVQEGSAAANAGIKEGDVIIKVEGKMIDATPQLLEILGRFRPGDKLDIVVQREGKEKTFEVKLKGEEEQNASTNDGKPVEEVYNKLGASFGSLTEAVKKQLGVKNGVIITDVRKGKLLDDMGIQKGTVVTEINGMKIEKISDIDKALESRKKDVIQIVGVSPDKALVTYQFQVR